jgi:hypothetical protein
LLKILAAGPETTWLILMPTEIRHVMFTPEEATVALRTYCISSGRPFPANPIYTLEGGGQPYVRISSLSDVSGKDNSVTFAGKELIAPLLLFCQRKRIPLPARGEKALTTLHNFLTLIIKIR